MAEGDGAVYNKAKERFLTGEIDLVDDQIDLRMMEGHSPDIDAHEDWADISEDEAAGDGYDAGGKAMGSGRTVTFDSGTDVATFDDTADYTWSSLDCGTPSHLVMVDDTHGDDALILYWELGRASNGGDYTIQFNASGILTLT